MEFVVAVLVVDELNAEEEFEKDKDQFDPHHPFF